MSYYTYSLHERTSAYDCYLVKPNFTPRKAGAQAEDSFDNQLDETKNVASGKTVHTLSPQEKSDLCKKLNNGQGGLSLQEWDDFLADMVDMGLISNDERMYANGLMREIPEAAQSNGAHFSYRPVGNLQVEPEYTWTGDPLKWLDDMDIFMLKNEMYANLECKNTFGYSAQRDAYMKVSQMLRDILSNR